MGKHASLISREGVSLGEPPDIAGPMFSAQRHIVLLAATQQETAGIFHEMWLESTRHDT